jgi:hypothetical protein
MDIQINAAAIPAIIICGLFALTCLAVLVATPIAFYQLYRENHPRPRRRNRRR